MIVGGMGSIATVYAFIKQDEANYRGVTLLLGIPFYALAGVGLYSNYTIQTNTFDENSTIVPWTLISIGAAIWTMDVLIVWLTGKSNKSDCKTKLGQLTLTYDAIINAPELVYSLRF